MRGLSLGLTFERKEINYSGYERQETRLVNTDRIKTAPVMFSGPKGKSMLIDGYSLYLDDILIHIGTIDDQEVMLLTGCDVTVQSFDVDMAFRNVYKK